MRNIYEVIQAMIDISQSEELTEKLEQIAKDHSYRAPEAEYLSWNLISQQLQIAIPAPREQWHYEILAIFMDKTVDEFKDYVKGMITPDE